MAAAVPYILFAASTASTYVSVQGQRESAKAEEAAFERDALGIERQGTMEEEAARIRLRKLIGTQRSLYAKANVDLSTGSPLTVLAATAEEGGRDIENIRTGTAERAAAARFGGASAGRTGRTRVTGTLLTGLASAGSSLYGSTRKPTGSSLAG